MMINNERLAFSLFLFIVGMAFIYISFDPSFLWNDKSVGYRREHIAIKMFVRGALLLTGVGYILGAISGLTGWF